MFRLLFAAVLVLSHLTLCSAAEQVGPERGTLVVVGGGRMPKEIVDEFIQRAGGKDVPFVIIPTASEGEDWGAKYVERSFLRRAGVQDITVLHTRDPKVADSEDFVAPLERARGVWIDGGRQWRLADSYLRTRTQRALFAVLDRGGVIGGSSAGATIQGSYLVRGAPEGNQIMMAPGHEEGFGFLKQVAIDQHVIARHREADMGTVIDAHPRLLGLGIDEATAIVVTGQKFRVVGASRVVVHHKDAAGADIGASDGHRYSLLSPGAEFDLTTRTAMPGPPGPGDQPGDSK